MSLVDKRGFATYSTGSDPLEPLEKEIIREFAKFSQDEKKEQVKFDTETNHGVISDKEAEWEKRYDVH